MLPVVFSACLCEDSQYQECSVVGVGLVYMRVFQKKWGPLPSPQGAVLQGGCWSYTILIIYAFCPQTQPLKSLHSLLVTVAEWIHPPLTTFGKANEALPAGSWGATCLFTPIKGLRTTPSLVTGPRKQLSSVKKSQHYLNQTKSVVSGKWWNVLKTCTFWGNLSQTLSLWWLLYIHETHAQLPGSSALSSDICAFLQPCRSKRNSRMWLASSRPWRWTTRSWTSPAMRRTACGWGRTFPQKWSPAMASRCPPRSSTMTATVE